MGKKQQAGRIPACLIVCSGCAHIAFSCNGFDWFLSCVGDELVYAFLKGFNVLLEIVEFFDEVIEIEPDRVGLPQTHWISFLIRDGIRGEGESLGKGIGI